MGRALAFLLMGIGVAACSGGAAVNANTPDANLVGVACTWPTYLDDAGRGMCGASRAYVACTDPAGDWCFCGSNGAETCDCSGFVTGGPWKCQYSCAPNQYVVSCSAPLPGTAPSAGASAGPPAGCTAMGATNPGGVTTYCCPCQ